MARTPSAKAGALKKRAASNSKSRSVKGAKTVRTLKPASTQRSDAKRKAMNPQKRPGVAGLGTVGFAPPDHITLARGWKEDLKSLLAKLVGFLQTVTQATDTTKDLVHESLRQQFNEIRALLRSIKVVPQPLQLVLAQLRDAGIEGNVVPLGIAINQATDIVPLQSSLLVTAWNNAVEPRLDVHWPLVWPAGRQAIVNAADTLVATLKRYAPIEGDAAKFINDEFSEEAATAHIRISDANFKLWWLINPDGDDPSDYSDIWNAAPPEEQREALLTIARISQDLLSLYGTGQSAQVKPFIWSPGRCREVPRGWIEALESAKDRLSGDTRSITSDPRKGGSQAGGKAKAVVIHKATETPPPDYHGPFEGTKILIGCVIRSKGHRDMKNDGTFRDQFDASINSGVIWVRHSKTTGLFEAYFNEKPTFDRAVRDREDAEQIVARFAKKQRSAVAIGSGQ